MPLTVLNRLSRNANSYRRLLDIEKALVAEARAEGYSWQNIADAIKTHRNNVIRRYAGNNHDPN